MSRVEGRTSKVEDNMSRVAGNMSRVQEMLIFLYYLFSNILILSFNFYTYYCSFSIYIYIFYDLVAN